MRRCRTCLMPDTRPDLHFDETGQCAACTQSQKKDEIDWPSRREELKALIARHDNRCIVASSGGKDSSYIVHTLLELGARPTIVTATTDYLTAIGRKNIDTLAQYATTIEHTPNQAVRRKIARIALETVGDISWGEHSSIFSTPFRMAVALGIPLIFFGECPQNAYGGPPGSEEAKQMTRRWTSEFGGMLGLRPSDFVGQDGITERDMEDYLLPTDEQLESLGVEAHFLGQYISWDSHINAEVAIEHGMNYALPGPMNWWKWENLDNAQTALHDHLMYRKYGFGRLCSQISVDIRMGLISREDALKIVIERDGLFPHKYMAVPLGRVLHQIGLSESALLVILDSFTNWELFEGVKDHRPLLREEWVLQ